MANLIQLSKIQNPQLLWIGNYEKNLIFYHMLYKIVVILICLLFDYVHIDFISLLFLNNAHHECICLFSHIIFISDVM